MSSLRENFHLIFRKTTSYANYLMGTTIELNKVKFSTLISALIPVILFWVVLVVRIPYPVTLRLAIYSFGLFAIVLLLYYLSLRLRDHTGVLAGLGLTMLLFASALSYKWTSGFSDNFMIGGLLPYKDAKNYYVGANLILHGQPLEKAGQATERPLFPGFLSSMLMLTGQNLKITLAIIVQLAGIGLYLSGREVRRFIGAFPASLYMTLMYFYIQPLIGYTLSEMLGFMLGCLASVLIWRASHNLKWADLTLGLMTLLVAVSARAGAFLIFPALVLWIGWIFRGERRFSLKMASGIFIVILIGYYLINTVYPLLLGVPSGSAFGNFSYALYGQIRGGTGWHSAIEELGTRDPSLVYRAGLQFFLQHPISLFIGFAKSYRDFFLLGNRSIFPFGEYSWQNWLNVVLWGSLLILFTSGLIQLVKNIRSKLSSLLIAGFVGVFLSIPFLPPIDGGSRLYASTMPFFFVIPALGLSQLTKGFEQNFSSRNDFQTATMASRSISIILLTLTLIVPVANYTLGQKSAYPVPSCPAEQKPFAIEVHQGSYIDLVREGTARCGLVPGVCLGDFMRNNREKTTDDYYQSLLQFMESSSENLQLIPAIDMVGGKFHYFHVSHNSSRGNLSSGLVSGCAVEVLTENQSVYEVSP